MRLTLRAGGGPGDAPLGGGECFAIYAVMRTDDNMNRIPGESQSTAAVIMIMKDGPGLIVIRTEAVTEITLHY